MTDRPPLDQAPRSTENLELNDHSMSEMRSRNIGGYEIKKAISEGEVYHGKHGRYRYVLSMPGPDLNVIVDPSDNEIKTAYYPDEQGATKGGI